MTRRIDLNADVGEGCGDDDGIIQIVTSCNIACGGHAGDAASMRAALRLAKRSGAAAGAHPSFPDRDGFGRRNMPLRGEALEESLCRQIGALAVAAADIDAPLAHVKPHGALYNLAASDPALAGVVAAATRRDARGAALVGPPSSALAQAAKEAGLRFIPEGFADRAYERDGRLRDRRLPGAVLDTDEARAEQALALAADGEVRAFDGAAIAMSVETICLHGDTPGALASAQLIRKRLAEAGVDIQPHT